MNDAHGDVHRITTLANGLRVVTEHVPGVRSVAVGAWIGTGSRHENDASRGYAHFLEHLLFKGNDRIDAEEISRYFDRIGTDVNAATTREYTVVHARVLDRHLADALGVLGEMVFAPRMAPDDVDAEREVILEEIAMYEDSPSDVVHELADLLVFPDHPLGLPIVGTTASIATARPGDVARFHAHHYRDANIVVSAAGAIDHDDFVRVVEEQFLARRAGATPVPIEGIDPTAIIVPPLPHVPQTELRRKDTEQVHLVLAGRGIRRDDERRHAAALLDTIFGNAPSSRLFLEVRERRGLAYSVYSFLSNHAEAGQSGLYVGVRPDRVGTVLDVVRRELDRITQEPPTQDEVELAKGHLEGRMLLSMESTTVRGNRLGASLINEMPIESLERTVERIHAVTRDDLLDLAREIFDPAALSLAAVAEDIDDVRAAADHAGLLSVERAGAST
ncbi:MAG: insulinase family protein [Thermoleophilia bacterium]|jgi:predicted Zn-dependent peptidase|nr:insulinase family protein [Thermoleophilia bacterium]